ncbi:MAG: hypothetical protein KDK40_03275, partial [Chlamydiia bacterium]|nr:hypothetical protein [Chlamydiia bacterium]
PYRLSAVPEVYASEGFLEVSEGVARHLDIVSGDEVGTLTLHPNNYYGFNHSNSNLSQSSHGQTHLGG